MINRSIALSLLSIFIVIAAIGGLAVAFFSDQGTSSNNVFATGTLDLKLSDSTPETDQDNVTASFGSNTLVPGSCTGDQTLILKNKGTIAANHAEVTVANAVTDTNDDASPNMDSFLRISKLEYDTVDKSGQITDQVADGNEFKDLADWAADPSVLDNLSLTDLDTGHNLVLNVCLDSSAGNPLQGDSIVATFTATLNQDASQ